MYSIKDRSVSISIEHRLNGNSTDGKSVALGENAVQVLCWLEISYRLPLEQTWWISVKDGDTRKSGQLLLWQPLIQNGPDQVCFLFNKLECIKCCMYINSLKCGLKCNYKSLMDFCQILEERSGNTKKQFINYVYMSCKLWLREKLYFHQADS